MRSALPLTALLVAGLAVAGVSCGSDDESSDTAPSTTVVTSEVTTSSVAETTTSSVVGSTTAGSITMAGQTVTVARLLTVAVGLCEAAAQAPNDVKTAEKTFNARSHDGLHLIARGLETIDRSAAAALLEAKGKVEGDFARSAAGAQVATDLRQLSEVTRSSLARFNVTAGACPPAA